MKNLFKKLLMATMSTALVVTSLVGITACNKPNPKVNSEPSAKEIFSMAAASGASFLDKGNAGVASVASAQAEVTRPISDETFNSIKVYLGMFEDMLTGGINQTVIESDRPEYNTKLEVSIAGEKVYDIYYTEKTVSDDKVVEVDDDDDEIKESTTLTGIIVGTNDETYNISGGRRVEVEKDGETETEIYFETKEILGTASVEVTQTHEIDPVSKEESTEFEYVISDGVNEPIEYSIEWEFEDGAHEMEVGVEQGGLEVEYSVKKISENKLEIECETENGEVETEDKIVVQKNEDGTYNFIYNNGYDKDVNVNINE